MVRRLPACERCSRAWRPGLIPLWGRRPERFLPRPIRVSNGPTLRLRTYLILVLVDQSTVDMPVSDFNGLCDGLLDLSGGRLPGAEADLGDLETVVPASSAGIEGLHLQGELLSEGHFARIRE